ncbi:30S ribosomal protein S4 [Candidatus Woesearchaeota archaeon]|nr:30S ribosomal protein S4 [Candidatus Woesearchaeota archaeon]
MGDPRKSHKKYKGPSHPWQRERLEVEKVLVKEYGLKTKTELWKSVSELRRVNGQAKKLIGDRGLHQQPAEEKQLMDRLVRYTILESGTQLEDVLGLDVKAFLNRRLQTQVHKQGLSSSPTQARQFIIHGHILVNGQKINVPSFMLQRGQEFQLTFHPHSSLAQEDHPERMKEKKRVEAVAEQKRIKDEEKAEAKKELEELKKVEKEVGLEVTE